MGSMISLENTVATDQPAILFSNADSRGSLEVKTSFSGRDRRNVTVRLTRDGGLTWPVAKVIEPGPSAYTDLVVADDGTIFMLYERSGVDGKGAFLPGKLTLATLNLAWLMAKE
ncbi:MAG: exo-alpha-sialidase [Phycisphaeraceae bacterium]|nr:exo-alpha-sialidase [Phycisphaeraceae bacterium]